MGMAGSGMPESAWGWVVVVTEQQQRSSKFMGGQEREKGSL